MWVNNQDGTLTLRKYSPVAVAVGSGSVRRIVLTLAKTIGQGVVLLCDSDNYLFAYDACGDSLRSSFLDENNRALSDDVRALLRERPGSVVSKIATQTIPLRASDLADENTDEWRDGLQLFGVLRQDGEPIGCLIWATTTPRDLAIGHKHELDLIAFATSTISSILE